ncbi:hypothetical protein [Parendozoicomonas haliclonae]|uniref:hypothetical protein n=1 Tax=Parendozoicomonas haliclonae TaxID=1960125 RepID=UPI001055BBC1|nr:hypothetical protein [Parendozoicomonas haliclonae]
MLPLWLLAAAIVCAPVMADQPSSEAMIELSDEQLHQALDEALPQPSEDDLLTDTPDVSAPPVVQLEQIYQDLQIRDVDSVRRNFISSLPADKQLSFRDSAYGWGVWAADQLKQEALAGGAALSMMALSAYGRTTLQSLLNNKAGPFLQNYGLLASDLGVDALTSQSWEDLALRSALSVVAWAGQERMGTVPAYLMRYVFSHAWLLKETWPDISRQLQPGISGVRKFTCLNSNLCEAVTLYYHIPDHNYSPDTGQPWLSLEFPWRLHTPVASNDLEEELLNLRRWAREEGVERVHIYPDMDNGQLKLWARYWKGGRSSRLYNIPGHYGVGSRSIWWTTLLQKKQIDSSGRQVINPLHVDILAEVVAALTGSRVLPVYISGDDPISAGDMLFAVSSGESGGVVVDSHYHQSFELPDLYLDTSTLFDDITRRALKSLNGYRTPVPARGLWKLGAGVLRSTAYRSAFEWGTRRLASRMQEHPESKDKCSPKDLKRMRRQLMQANFDSGGAASSDAEESSASSEPSAKQSNESLTSSSHSSDGEPSSGSVQSSAATLSSTKAQSVMVSRDGASEIDSVSESSQSRQSSDHREAASKHSSAKKVSVDNEAPGSSGDDDSSEPDDSDKTSESATTSVVSQPEASPELVVSGAHKTRRIVVMGRDREGNRAFMKQLAGTLPARKGAAADPNAPDFIRRKYEPTAVEGIDEPVEFVEILVGDTGDQAEDIVDMKHGRLLKALRKADNLIWCADIRTYKPASNTDSFTDDEAFKDFVKEQEAAQSLEHKIFEHVATMGREVKKPLMVALTHAGDDKTYATINFPKVPNEPVPDEQGLDVFRRHRLYSLAAAQYQKHEKMLGSDGVILVADGRQDEEKLHYRALAIEKGLRNEITKELEAAYKQKLKDRTAFYDKQRISHTDRTAAILMLRKEYEDGLKAALTPEALEAAMNEKPATWWQAAVERLKVEFKEKPQAETE